MSSRPDRHLDAALSPGGVRSVFQPIVDLDTGEVVAYEALARGPEGPLARPDDLFAAARAVGRLAELDAQCRAAAFRGAIEHGLLAPLTVFVNVEPEVLDSAPLDELLALAAGAPGELRIVLEITERALAARPAELLRTVERVRALGWGVAVDDVGADALSLAFLPLLAPDVVKLDLRLVQERPGPAIAQIMNAVNAHAERTGALILAEGIETEEHLTIARALGATLGQGWWFGRPVAGPSADRATGTLRLPTQPEPPPGERGTFEVSPFGCLPPQARLRRSPKALLIELSKQLEREAMRLGDTCVVAATFQEARHVTPSTAQRYRDLVERTGFVSALGEGLDAEPLPGVRGSHIDPADPVRGEWDLVVLAPHFSAALLARDLGDDGPDLDRTFEYALTYHRPTVVRAATALLSRVAPRITPAQPQAAPAHAVPAVAAAPRAGGVLADGEGLLRHALAATTSGIAIADLRRPDQPLVYVNEAFERLSGMAREEVLGRNCRFLQGADTDPAAVARMRSAVDRGEECREILLNHRGPDRTPWWNEVHLAPVHDTAGHVIHYIGIQHDVTARVEAERALQEERDRNRIFLARIEELTHTDPVTGLPDRLWLEPRLETALWNARTGSDTVALLVLALDGVPGINQQLGHLAGDAVLRAAAAAMRSRLRRSDLIARLGGNEFLVALPALDRATAVHEARRVGADLAAAVQRAVPAGAGAVGLEATVGAAVYPDDGDDVTGLLRAAHTGRTRTAASST